MTKRVEIVYVYTATGRNLSVSGMPLRNQSKRCSRAVFTQDDFCPESLSPHYPPPPLKSGVYQNFFVNVSQSMPMMRAYRYVLRNLSVRQIQNNNR